MVAQSQERSSRKRPRACTRFGQLRAPAVRNAARHDMDGPFEAQTRTCRFHFFDERAQLRRMRNAVGKHPSLPLRRNEAARPNYAQYLQSRLAAKADRRPLHAPSPALRPACGRGAQAGNADGTQKESSMQCAHACGMRERQGTCGRQKRPKTGGIHGKRGRAGTKGARAGSKAQAESETQENESMGIPLCRPWLGGSCKRGKGKRGHRLRQWAAPQGGGRLHWLRDGTILTHAACAGKGAGRGRRHAPHFGRFPTSTAPHLTHLRGHFPFKNAKGLITGMPSEGNPPPSPADGEDHAGIGEKVAEGAHAGAERPRCAVGHVAPRLPPMESRSSRLTRNFKAYAQWGTAEHGSHALLIEHRLTRLRLTGRAPTAKPPGRGRLRYAPGAPRPPHAPEASLPYGARSYRRP